MNDSPGVAGMPISARERHVMASSSQTFPTTAACFTRPSSVALPLAGDRAAAEDGQPPDRRTWRMTQGTSRLGT
jgi:hypothetical protein